MNGLWKMLGILQSICHTYIDGLVQERRNSSAVAMELRLSCTNPLIYVDAFSDCFNEIESL